jgi:signal transduction histidine kinase
MHDIISRINKLQNLEAAVLGKMSSTQSYSSEELDQILDLARLINTCSGMDQTLQALLQESIQLVNAERGVLVTYDSQNEPIIQLAYYCDGTVIKNAKERISFSIIHKVLNEGNPIKSENLADSSNFSTTKSIVNLALLSSICVPLKLDDKVIGAIYVDSSCTSIFTKKMMVMMEGFCELGSIALYHLKMRREAEDRFTELRDLQEHSFSVVDSLPNTLLIFDKDGKVLFNNRRFHEVLEGLSCFIPDIKAKAGFRMSLDLICEIFSLESEDEHYNLEINNRVLRFWPFVVKKEISLNPSFGVIIADVSYERMLQEQVLEHEKMSMVSNMAGSIAHEIRNALAPLMGQADIMEMKFAQDMEHTDPYKQGLHIISEMAEKINRIAANLSDLSKPQKVLKTGFDINQLLKRVTEILYESGGKIKQFQLVETSDENVLDSDFQVVLDLAENLPELSGDRDQIMQMLMNLIINASHALESKGKGRVLLKTRLEERHILLEVSDNGSGIPRNLLKKIWEPYFTTKGERKGTGLGLMLVRMVCDSHLIKLKLASEEGLGTCFSMRFPLLKTK